jgi:hypothetical protein
METSIMISSVIVFVSCFMMCKAPGCVCVNFDYHQPHHRTLTSGMTPPWSFTLHMNIPLRKEEGCYTYSMSGREIMLK